MIDDDLPVSGAEEPAVSNGEAADKDVNAAAGAKEQPAAEDEADTETKAEAEAGAEDDAEDGDGDDAEDEDEDERRPRRRRSSAARARARMERLIAEKAALEERLANVAAQNRREERTAVDDDPKPKAEDFQDPFELAAEVAAWRSRQEFKKAISAYAAEANRQNAERARAEQRHTAVAAYRDRVAEFAKTVKDFGEVVSSADDVPMPPYVEAAIIESEVGPALAYHLARNPRTAERIAGLTPIAAAIELGKLAERLTPKKARLETKAKPPIAVPKGASPNPPKDPSKMSFEEFDKWREGGGKL